MEKEEVHWFYGEIEGEPMMKWQGPFENERWEAEHAESVAFWDKDWESIRKALPAGVESPPLPFRVHRKRWTLGTVKGQLRVDLVYWRDSGQCNYRAVFEDDDTFANFDTLREAQVILEGVARDDEVES